MGVKGLYRCLDCGELFENRVQAQIHHLRTKHENYELVDCDVRITIKS